MSKLFHDVNVYFYLLMTLAQFLGHFLWVLCYTFIDYFFRLRCM